MAATRARLAQFTRFAHIVAQSMIFDLIALCQYTFLCHVDALSVTVRITGDRDEIVCADKSVAFPLREIRTWVRLFDLDPDQK